MRNKHRPGNQHSQRKQLAMDTNEKILLKPGQGKSLWVLGDLYTFKATGRETGGAFTVMDQIIQPQGGPPPHIHHREDETFYVLEGRFSFLCGDKQTIFDTGSFIHIPKGTLHTFKNLGEKPGRILVTITPAGLEEFFYAIGTPTTNQPTPPAFDPSVIDKIIALSPDYQMEIRG